MQRAPIGILLLLVSGAAACKGARADVTLSKSASAKEQDIAIENVPVPPEDGPKLVALKADVPVLERPKKDAVVIGGLRVGGAVARAKEPITRSADCEGGYYPVRPRGFVCADGGVSLGATADLIPGPDTSHPLPYRYALVKSATPLYARVPTVAEQNESEPNLDRYLAKIAKAIPTTLRAGANDVPLDERGVASGRAVIARTGQGVGEDGKRSVASFFELGTAMTAPAISARANLPAVAMVLRKGSGVAIMGTTSIEGPSGPRTFGITPDMNLVPLDRVEPALGSTFHGVDLTKEKGLPMGFTLRHEVCPYALTKGKAKRLDDEEMERRTPVFLSNRFRTVEIWRYEEAEEGVWFREKDIIKIVKRAKFPEFVHEDTKWIDVSLALQTLTLYEGRKAVYATLVSTGKDVVGDPETTASTKQGTFTVSRKGTSMQVDAREVDQAYDILDAPYVLEFSPGFAITGSFWSDPAGEARGFHNVAVTPIDAHRIFTWAGAEVPSGFRWIAPKPEETVTVVVRK